MKRRSVEERARDPRFTVTWEQDWKHDEASVSTSEEAHALWNEKHRTRGCVALAIYRRLWP